MNNEPYTPVTLVEELGLDALAPRKPDAVRHLQAEVQRGRPWHEALLEAMGMWTLPQEQCNGRGFSYIIQGEAFDWLLLAERLCGELDCLVPREEL